MFYSLYFKGGNNFSKKVVLKTPGREERCRHTASGSRQPDLNREGEDLTHTPTTPTARANVQGVQRSRIIANHDHEES